jgi:lipopolysaccharide biosynthesis glycosyltransferase
LLALCRSFLALHPQDEIVVVRTSSDGLTMEDQARLTDAGARFVDLSASDLMRLVEACLPAHRSKYGLETYAKVALVETALEPFYWIDSDIIIRSVIDPSNARACGGLAAASPHPRSRGASIRDVDDPRLHAWLHKLGTPQTLLSETPSFNCGFMWLDPVRLREAKFPELVRSALNVLAKQLVTADESIFNLLAHKLDIRFFPTCSQTYVAPSHTLTLDPDQTWMVHFVGSVKPWMAGPSHPGWAECQQWLCPDELPRV